MDGRELSPPAVEIERTDVLAAKCRECNRLFKLENPFWRVETVVPIKLFSSLLAS